MQLQAGAEALCSRLGTWRTARGRGPVLAVRPPPIYSYIIIIIVSIVDK